MIVTLQFNLPEERDEYLDAMNGYQYKDAVEQIYQQMLRPANKHGYSNERLQYLIENVAEAPEIIELLSQIYIEITQDLEHL